MNDHHPNSANLSFHLGLKPGTLSLAPYCEEWKCLFETEKRGLLAAIGKQVVDIQHIGSTAIPGMPSKPILDIGIAVYEFENACTCIEPLSGIGYTFRGENGIPRRHYFTKGDPTTHHVHMVEETSDDWRKMIRFRDLLRSDPKTSEDYCKLKLGLGERFSGDRKAHQAAKAEFNEEVLQRKTGQ